MIRNNNNLIVIMKVVMIRKVNQLILTEKREIHVELLKAVFLFFFLVGR
jgi:hypothetical protein